MQDVDDMIRNLWKGYRAMLFDDDPSSRFYANYRKEWLRLLFALRHLYQRIDALD